MKILPYSLLEDLAARASASPRARAHHNIHAGPSELVQRFLVAANRNSYFRPHRHTVKAELALVLRGRFTILTFDADGTLTGRYAVGEGTDNMAYETPAATWHTLRAETDGAAFLEVKEGPYDPATAAEFAAWAPAEGDAAATAFLEWTRTAEPGDRVPSL